MRSSARSVGRRWQATMSWEGTSSLCHRWSEEPLGEVWMLATTETDMNRTRIEVLKLTFMLVYIGSNTLFWMIIILNRCKITCSWTYIRYKINVATTKTIHLNIWYFPMQWCTKVKEFPKRHQEFETISCGKQCPFGLARHWWQFKNDIDKTWTKRGGIFC